MSQHKLIRLENKFTAGVASTGGAFTKTMPGLNFIADYWVVREVLYDGADGLQYPVNLNSTAFGGHICTFLSASSQGAGVTPFPVKSSPGTYISNTNKVDLSGQSVDFSCSNYTGTAITALSGVLTVVLEAVKSKPKKHASSAESKKG